MASKPCVVDFPGSSTDLFRRLVLPVVWPSRPAGGDPLQTFGNSVNMAARSSVRNNKPDRINHSEGRHLFGLDPQGYDATRPDYPLWMFEELRASRALFDGAATLEIGPGSGLATRRLVEHGAAPLTLVEPDDRFAEMLRKATRQLPTCTVIHESFEEASLADDAFDLAVAATSFHWIDPVSGMRKLRNVLKRGGTAALIWNGLQDLDKADPFHDATEDLLASLAVSSSGAPTLCRLRSTVRPAKPMQGVADFGKSRTPNRVGPFSYIPSKWQTVRGVFSNSTTGRRFPLQAP